jgi:CheY-like chemotaxis protein
MRNRQIICDMLAPTDYEITEAESGEEALAVIAKHSPAGQETEVAQLARELSEAREQQTASGERKP